MTQSQTLADTRAHFIEMVGLSMQSDGLPRIAGRLLGLLIWDGAVVSFSDLATNLAVSRGSISTATRFLAERGLIRRTARPGERQDYFQLADAPYRNMLDTLGARMQRVGHEIDATLADIPAAQTDIRDRIGAYRQMFDSLEIALKSAKDRIQ